MTALVIMPTYDEADNIEQVVGRLRVSVPSAHVLVVDDASPDGTGQMAEALAAADPQVRVLHRPAKEGLGAAYLTGFAWGLRRGYDVLVEMDADGSHLPEQLPRLLTAHERGADLVLGSRWVPGGSVVNWPRRRELLSRAANRYVRLALRLPLRDATAGFRLFDAGAVEHLELDDVASQGYCFQVDLARRAVAAGLEVAEVPITFVERTQGKSKMAAPIVFEALWRVSLWGLRHRLARPRLLDWRQEIGHTPTRGGPR